MRDVLGHADTTARPPYWVGLPEAPPVRERYRGRILRYGHRPLPFPSDIVRFGVGPGEVVTNGSRLASLEDVFEGLRATGDAVVLGHADSSLAVPAVPLGSRASRQ